jgi:hypothetical protein
MTETVFRGPAYSAGSLIDGRIEGASDGPGLEYQANAFPDPRWFPTRKDGSGPGRVPAFLNSPFTVLVDAIPSSTSTTSIAAAQAAASGTPLTLTTVAPGGASGVPSLAPVPLVPFQKGISSLVQVLALDFGFTTGNITAGSATISSIPDSSIFQPGQWICVGGGGNSAKTASLMTQVITVPSATSITVSPAPAGTLTAAPIGSANLPSGPYAPPGVTPSGVDPYLTAGLARLFNPQEGVARNIQITANAGATGGNVVVRGWDIYGNPMSETIVAAAASTVAGKKAFKYLATGAGNLTGGIVPQFTDAGHTYSAGPGNVVGINLRSVEWEFLNTFYNGAFATSSAGWTAADQTNPATATTGDVRGTINVNSGTAPLNAAFDGTKRIMIAQTVRLTDDIYTTPINFVPLFGQPQFTA